MALFPAVLALLLSWTPSAQARAAVWIRHGEGANGTGWVIDTERRRVVTAAHVLGDRQTVDVSFFDFGLGPPRTDRQHYLADQADLAKRGRTATAKVIARRSDSDLALLELDRLPPGIPALPLAAHRVRLGEACTLVGHRHDSELLWLLTAGRVRQAGRLSDGYFTAGRRVGAGVPLLLLQSPIEAGESGSAVLNASGEVIGVVSATVNAVSGLALAVDVSEVRSLLADARKQAPSETPAERNPEPPAILRATVWVRPQATSGRFAGVLIDAERRLMLTSAAAVGSEPVVDVIVPKWDLGRLVPEADAYSDRLGLRLSGHCVGGMVLARDSDRDLALVELDALPPGLEPLRLTAEEPRAGDAVASAGHPTGIDMLWLYAAGTVRSVGPVELNPGDHRPKVRACLLQLPHQGASSGGPVVNAAGELVGILSSREAARQELAFAAGPGEVRTFLDAARPTWGPRTRDEWLRRGRLALRCGRFEGALTAFQNAATGERQFVPFAVAGQASALIGLRRPADAKRCAITVVNRKDIVEPNALAEAADVLRAAGDGDGAAAAVERALAADPRCAPALVVRARLTTGRAAEADIAAALDGDPTFAPAYPVRAGLRDQSSDEGRRLAIGDLGRALELHPMDLAALRDRAVLFQQIREPKKAVADWNRLTEFEPFAADHWIGLARARFGAGDRSGAAEALRSALRVSPAASDRVFVVVRELASDLEADNPADRERVAEWRAIALNRLAAWLPK